MHEPVQDAPANPRQAVGAAAQREREDPRRADFEADFEHLTGYCQPMQTSIDVFAKARESERLELMRAARELDMVPYFRVLEGPTLPVVRMEGKQRIMLGSNNYLGLTGDERVRQGALDALHRYGTGITGSRFLNGTLELHLELERELAEWLGTEAAVVFTTGHQANLSALGTILGPNDTVIADSGDHASILDGILLSRAKLRAFKHNRLDLLERRLEAAAHDGGGILVVVDGVFSAEGDVAPLAGDRATVRRVRGEADGRRGARAGGAGRPRGRDLRAARRRGRGRPADGHVLEVARLVRRRGRRAGRRDRVPALPGSVVHLHRLGGAGGRRRGARRGQDLPLGRGPAAVREGARQRRAISTAASPSSASGSSSRPRG